MVKEERENGRKKRKKEKTCTNRPSFPLLLTNPFFRITKVVTSSHLGLFSKVLNFDGKTL